MKLISLGPIIPGFRLGFEPLLRLTKDDLLSSILLAMTS